MKKLLITLSSIIFVVLFTMIEQARADCATVSDELTIYIPSAEIAGFPASDRYSVTLDIYNNAIDPSNFYFSLSDVRASESQAPSSSAFIDNNLNINIVCANVLGINYKLLLSTYKHPQNNWFYWKFVNAVPVANGENNKPIAESASLNVDSTVPYIVQQLIAHDPDSDTITYELTSPSTGQGYSSAYINPLSGKLYLTHEPDGNQSFTISFRVTDGKLFSDPASVTVQVSYLSNDNKETGKIDVSPEEYSTFSISAINSKLFGAVGEQPTVPKSIDLSVNFPNPGDQGNQSSCVGWATAYALKSYHEKVEIGWELNTPSHLFSPAFIYNQINGGQDNGSYIDEALDLAVKKGVATLSTMPYSDRDYKTQPSSAAFTEAAKFKALTWNRISGTAQIKAALANRKPVIGGIDVYQQLMDLKGSDSVYNTASGQNQGGHAITIVGYDDNKYGGAFKVINSWSQNWGDKGFFWITYSFASNIMSETYVLEDATNSETVIPVEPTKPEPNNNILPNLTIVDWNASYDPRPRGYGELTYNVKNTGSGVAYAGADVSLLLSADTEFTINDDYVVYETIPFDLKTGESVYRDSNNSIPFMFPDQLNSGTYYMALWVDDMDILEESNEDDNISVGTTPINIENTLPDLQVNTWYAKWDRYGNGTLTYEIINSGSSSTTSMDWDINLILDKDQVVGNENEIYLFYETTNFFLAPGEIVYRRTANPTYFNLYTTYDGYTVPSGTYYMALWVDDMNVESESNELNNGSYSSGTVRIGGRSGLNSSQNRDSNRSDDTSTQGLDVEGSAYNGKVLPNANKLSWKKVEITRGEDGATTMKIVEDGKEANYEITDEEQKCKDDALKQGTFASEASSQGLDTESNDKESQIYTKTIEAKSKVIFPSSSSVPMPSISNP
ncbi:MAG: hypothetical protein HQK72_06760 [Desulfamplus sp.]|nr:hypothetical protein [Desulfamplus sp.]